jgi:hypothetical protein
MLTLFYRMKAQFDSFVKQHGIKDEQNEKFLKLKTLEAGLAEAKLAAVRPHHILG